jgi:hypothetical protein
MVHMDGLAELSLQKISFFLHTVSFVLWQWVI